MYKSCLVVLVAMYLKLLVVLGHRSGRRLGMWIAQIAVWCCESSSECWLVLGGFTHLLHAGIYLRTTEFFVRLIHLTHPCTVHTTLL